MFGLTKLDQNHCNESVRWAVATRHKAYAEEAVKQRALKQ